MQSFSCLDQCPSEQQCYLGSVENKKRPACILIITSKSIGVINNKRNFDQIILHVYIVGM